MAVTVSKCLVPNSVLILSQQWFGLVRGQQTTLKTVVKLPTLQGLLVEQTQAGCSQVSAPFLLSATTVITRISHRQKGGLREVKPPA